MNRKLWSVVVLITVGAIGTAHAGQKRPLPLPGGKAAVALRRSTSPPSPATAAAAFDLHNVCASRLAPGPAGSRDRRVDLSGAHAMVRVFGLDSPYATSDSALAAALADDASLTSGGIGAALAAYAGALPDVCAAPAGAATPRGAAEVAMAGRVAMVRPGMGTVNLPPATQLVVVDLRDLPVNGLAGMLAEAVAPAMRTDSQSPRRWVRTHNGPVDEVLNRFQFYSTGIAGLTPPRLAASGARDLPIVLVVGERIAPEAAALAAGLRAARRAWIAGAALPVAIGEMEWRGVGQHGLAIRTSIAMDPIPLHDDVFRGAAAQDDSFDPASASYKRNFTIGTDARTLEVSLTGGAGTDLDLYLLHDANGDGVFDPSSELVGQSFSPTSEERIALAEGALGPGQYQLWVHGYSVPSGRTPVSVEAVQGTVLPDIIPADVPASLVDPIAADALARAVIGHTPPRVAGTADRSFPAQVDPFGLEHPTSQTRGDLRAGLIAAHGMVRLFFRYLPVVGDTIDARLVETLASVDGYDGVDRVAAWRILRRFGESLRDGHQFVFSFEPLFQTSLPVFLEHAGERPIVRRSLAPDIHPGDTIVALNGRAIEDVYDEELGRTSAATDGYKRDIADRYVYNMNGPITITVEDPDGKMRVVTVAPQPIADYNEVNARGVSDRPSGRLVDLGAPDVYYLNMNAYALSSDAQMRVAIADASAYGSKGLILDMRDYPAGNPYEVAARLIQQPFLSPRFMWTTWLGPGIQSLIDSQFPVDPLSAPAYGGPIVLLTSPHAVSAAENFMQMIVGARRPLAIVGRQSAGTNGNMTAVSLPGGFGFTYTGMEVRNPDGSVFHGAGITPDITVPVTAADLKAGTDRDLVTALALLH